MPDIIISGYHGFKNSGDEALLYAILNTLKKMKPDISVTVLSKTPEETARVYGVKSISRYNFFKIKNEMKNSKMLLFGGGSLLQDITSSKSILYYLGIIFLAQKCGIKTMLYANGIGPIVKRHSRKLAKKILNKVDIITLRDDKSDVELKNLGITKPKIVITADPAFTIDTDVSLSGKYFMDRAGVPEGRKVFVVSIREWKKLPHDFVVQLAELCDYMIDKYEIYPLFVPLQYPADLQISEMVIEKMVHSGYIITRELSVAEMFCVLSASEIIIGMRLHSLIYATTLAIPAMALVYDPKISAFMDSINQPDWIKVEEFNCTIAKEKINIIMEENGEKREYLRKTNANLRKKAEENALFAIKLLEEKR